MTFISTTKTRTGALLVVIPAPRFPAHYPAGKSVRVLLQTFPRFFVLTLPIETLAVLSLASLVGCISVALIPMIYAARDLPSVRP